ncbi:monooxygenase [Symbioplanes lichenis]|uniref:monooxygenase n=1 Tax=Symbioplanes lichenis TaxID=1629072 RepID=UPI00273A38E6|nr:monooxygenase [Actinoplanes lichenis]
MRVAPAAVAVVLLLPVAACAGEPEAAAPAPQTATHEQHSAVAAPPLRPGERFADLTVAQPYTPVPPNGGTDEYRCMVLDPQVAHRTYLTGSQFEPQNVAIAHHALVFSVPPAGAAAARARDAADPGEGYTCFGDAGLDDTTWVDTWTPNVAETLLDGDLGYVLDPGSLLILQVHYNLLTAGAGGPPADRSNLRLRLTDGTPRTVALATTPLMAPIELPCGTGETGALCDRATAVADVEKRFGDAGEASALLQRCSGGAAKPGTTQRCDHPIPGPMTVYAARGHMHMLGRAISIELNPGTPAARTLLDVPAFDFDNQALRVLPEPVTLKAGDTVRVTCTHDASLRRQIPQLRKLPPRYVVWGEGTSDEMCLGLLTTSSA